MMMRPARFRHGKSDPRTPGVLIAHGPSHDFLAAVHFGGPPTPYLPAAGRRERRPPRDRVLDMVDTSSIPGPHLPSPLGGPGLISLASVGKKHANKLVPIEDMDELPDLHHAHQRPGPSLP